MNPPRENGLIPGCRKKNFPRLGARAFLRRDNIPPCITQSIWSLKSICCYFCLLGFTKFNFSLVMTSIFYLVIHVFCLFLAPTASTILIFLQQRFRDIFQKLWSNILFSIVFEKVKQKWITLSKLCQEMFASIKVERVYGWLRVAIVGDTAPSQQYQWTFLKLVNKSWQYRQKNSFWAPLAHQTGQICNSGSLCV